MSHAGRPSIIATPEEFEQKVDEYFAIPDQSITVTGLCLHLGFESRQSFYDYADRDGFSYIVKKARLMIENQYEKGLQKKFPTGAIFALKNMGWKDRQEIEGFGNIKQTIIVEWQEPPLSIAPRVQKSLNGHGTLSGQVTE